MAVQIESTKIRNREYVRRRKLILTKSRELFWTRGYKGTSMSLIASTCSYEKSNLYHYFPDKETILYEICKDEMNYGISKHLKLKDQYKDDPIEHLKIFIETQVNIELRLNKQANIIFDYEIRNLSSSRIKEITAMRDQLDKMLRDILSKGIEIGVFMPMDINIIAAHIFSMIIRTKLWYSVRGRLSKNNIADITSSFVLSGIAK